MLPMPGKSHKKIVVIGGGTGSFTLLSSLKRHTPELTALVNMADDGGSTGILRDELGVLPPGDVRQCLVALSDSSQALRDLFNYRFPKGSSFSGHSFGNLFLSAVERMTDDFGEAVNLASEVLQITGRVLPITLENCHLVMETDGGSVKGEYRIAQMALPPGERPDLRLEPKAQINPAARKAIMSADLVVIAPGNLYGSLVPALLVSGVAAALSATKARVVYVCNLVNKPTQTKDYGVHDYVRELERFSSPGTIDAVIYNTDIPSEQVLKAYALDGEYPVAVDDDELNKLGCQLIGGKFLSDRAHERNDDDTFILRSLIRHDADAVSQALLDLASR
jgi:uncharacterized cofD-like protein